MKKEPAKTLGGRPDEFGRAVQARYGRLTRGQRRAADYIVARQFDDCAFLTSSQIGERAGVSETTVIRLATALGFTGFANMQQFIRSGLVRNRIDRFERTSAEMRDEQAILADVAQLDSDNVQQTLRRTNPADLARAAEMILAAPAVCTVGLRTSAATASYLTAALNQLFGNVTPLSSSMGDHMDRLRGMAPGTVVIGVSFLRYARHTFEVMRYARKLGLGTIVITDSVTAPPVPFGDLCLLVSTSSVHYLPSQTAGLSLVNALLGSIALRGQDRVVASLRRFEDSLKESDVFCLRK